MAARISYKLRLVVITPHTVRAAKIAVLHGVAAALALILLALVGKLCHPRLPITSAVYSAVSIQMGMMYATLLRDAAIHTNARIQIHAAALGRMAK